MFNPRGHPGHCGGTLPEAPATSIVEKFGPDFAYRGHFSILDGGQRSADQPVRMRKLSDSEKIRFHRRSPIEIHGDDNVPAIGSLGHDSVPAIGSLGHDSVPAIGSSFFKTTNAGQVSVDHPGFRHLRPPNSLRPAAYGRSGLRSGERTSPTIPTLQLSTSPTCPNYLRSLDTLQSPLLISRP